MQCIDCQCTLQTRIEESWGRCDTCQWLLTHGSDDSGPRAVTVGCLMLMFVAVAVIIILALGGYAHGG